jgi:hypothetical protein
MADHLSCLSSYKTIIDESPINELFTYENLFCAGIVSYIGSPWYADITNYLATNQIPSHWFKLDKQKFLRNVCTFFRMTPTYLNTTLTKLLGCASLIMKFQVSLMFFMR